MEYKVHLIPLNPTIGFTKWRAMVVDYDPTLPEGSIISCWEAICSGQIFGYAVMTYDSDSETHQPSELAGFMHWSSTRVGFVPGETVHLQDFYIKPEWREMYVGESALRVFLGELAKLPVSRAWWETAQFNVIAQGLYDKVGTRDAVRYLVDFARNRKDFL
jgi:ribosomal protein S18 acetylase RimI-like enzyme